MSKEEQKGVHIFSFPIFFNHFNFLSYLDFQQLSSEEWEREWYKKGEEWIEEEKIEIEKEMVPEELFEEEDLPDELREVAEDWAAFCDLFENPNSNDKEVWGEKLKKLEKSKEFKRLKEWGDGYIKKQRKELELEDKERQKFERLKRNFELSQEVEKTPKRESIPEAARIAVWRRDGGECAKCGSRKNLEYDHIIPVSRGGSNTVRNIELLCEECNRKKRDNIE